MNTGFDITKITVSTLMLGLALPAWAHTGFVKVASFSEGFAHPWLGIGHLLVTFVVGFWSCYSTSKTLWYLPVAFLAAMALGAFMACDGIVVPAAELGEILPLWIIGLCIGLNKLPVPLWSILLLTTSGICHGYSHALEVTSHTDYSFYLIGVFAATLLLQAIGMVAGRMATQTFPSLAKITGLGCIAVSTLAISG